VFNTKSSAKVHLIFYYSKSFLEICGIEIDNHIVAKEKPTVSAKVADSAGLTSGFERYE
jgi:hypothetical protein